MEPEVHCPKCGNVIPSAALNGLCPVCLLQAGHDAGSPSAEHEVSVLLGPAASGVLSHLAESLGGLPRVLLCDTDPESGPSPVIQPGSPEMPDPADRSVRLQFFGEIARGGMGAILKGRDPDLGRDLAVKVLLEDHRDRPELVRRFVEEAQIAGQLQHPGIVPVYELGAFADRRLYFAMKLVKGRTLASLLADRKTPAGELPRLLGIFEQVAQTVAYAHARGVIHRDLKPSNIMVGSFGEVQVMDWGLAKVLPRGGAVDDAAAGKTDERQTVIATARSKSDAEFSQAGSVMGTPAYMAPEQARGDVDQIDERCDVFALGSILCEILTGQPAFTGRNSGEIQRKAARGELADAFALLDRSGVDAELISMTKACLASEKEDRPRHAGKVAEQISAYRIGVQERLRLAEIAQAEEKARAVEAGKRARVERDRRRLTIALAAAVLGFVVLGGGGWTYVNHLRSARLAATERAVTQALDEATLKWGQAKASPVGDLSKWSDALNSARQASSALAAGEPSTDLQARVEQLLSLIEHEESEAVRRADEADRDRKLVERLDRIRLSRVEEGERWNAEKTDADYAKAFREFGIDVDRLDPTASGNQLSQRSNPPELAFFLDDWAQVRLIALTNFGGETKNDSWKRLVQVAGLTDPDPWRIGLRAQIGTQDQHTLKRLAADEKALATQPARSLLLLAQLLEAQAEIECAEVVLERAWRRQPDDFWTCSQLGRISKTEARRFITAAVSLRPRNAWSHVALARAFLPECRFRTSFTWSATETSQNAGPVFIDDLSKLDQKALDRAIVEYQEAIRLSPKETSFHVELGRVLLHKEGKLNEAMARYREAIRLEPESSTWRTEAARAFAFKDRIASAIVEVRHAIRLGAPETCCNHIFLGSLLQKQNKMEEAFGEFRKAYLLETIPGSLDIIRRFLHVTGKADDEIAVYRERVHKHPDDSFTIAHLGEILRNQGKTEKEIALYREAIELDSKVPGSHYLLGQVLARQGKRGESKAEYETAASLLRQAIRVKPDDAEARWQLVRVLYAQGKRDEAVKQAREVIRISPSSNLFGALGTLAYSEGKVDEAMSLYREGIRLNPKEHANHNNLGCHYLEFGETDLALAEISEALRIQPKDPYSLGSLGGIHFARGELKEALSNLREANRLHQPPLAENKARFLQAERLSALEGGIESILRGKDVPTDPRGRLDVADLCRLKGRFTAATTFYREAFQARPALANDLSAQHRFHAALASAQAGMIPNRVNEAPPLDDAERSRLRIQALDWLRAERDACAKLLTQNSHPQRTLARKTLDILKHHRDLAPLRDEAALKKLPEAERKKWQDLWTAVDRLLKNTDRP